MLDVKTLNQFYGGSHTLWDVDLAVPAGSRMCLMGRNGMGKTTLLRCIMGLQPASSEGIQPNVVHEIGDIILKLNKEEGLTVLLVEQKLPFARRVASEFCILDKGRHVAAGPIDELTDDVVRAHLSV